MSKKNKKNRHEQTKRPRTRGVARPLAPEDIAPGDYVCVLSQTYEWFPFCCASEYGRVQVQRVTLVPNETEPPVLVEAVSLPFVFVRESKGKRRMLDARRVRLARVSGAFGRAAFAGLGAD